MPMKIKKTIEITFEHIKGSSTSLIMKETSREHHTEMLISHHIKVTMSQAFELNSKSLRLREPDTTLYCYWECKQVETLQGERGHLLSEF